MSESFFVEQDGLVIIHRFVDSSDAAVDAWADAFSDFVDTLSPDQPFRILLDVSAKQVFFTRYARQKSVELFTGYGHRQGRLALLFSSKIAPYFTRIFFASLGKLTFEHAHFSNREQAMAWLRG